MSSYIFLLETFYVLLLLFLGLYFYYKTKYALQAYQQSSYNFKRYIKYIKENYKYTLGVNELLLVLIIVIFYNVSFSMPFLTLFKYFLLIFFTYYNLKFFNISRSRYTQKLPLKITSRVKRLLFTLVALILIVFIILLNVLNSIILAIVIFTYFINFLILLAGFVNKPIEKFIYNNFKTKAKNKINSFSNLTVIGITGSYGKTSIKNIVFDILKSEKITLKTPSSFNTPMGVSITVDQELNKMYENFIVEMGAYYKGEIKELCDMSSPKIGIVSSIGKQHLETFKTIETIQSTKMELIESLPKDGLGVLNYDNKYIRDYKIKNNVKMKWYSLENENVDLYAYDVKYLEDGMEFKIKFEGNVYNVKTLLLGKYNIYNILAGILVADFEGISMDNIVSNILTIDPIPNRLEFKRINSNLTIIDDSFNGNVDGMIEGINILKHYKNKKILITPGIIDGGNENDLLNEKVSENILGIDSAIIIGKYNRDALTKNIHPHVTVKCYDNFIDGYNEAIKDDVSKTILIANDLPDKYNK